jgi:uncharacterized protein (TIGR00369 family)
MDRAARVEELAGLNRVFAQHIALNKAVGLEFVELGDRWALMWLPWEDRFVGDPSTGALHGGVITILMDSACGAAAFMGLPKVDAIATLDLRIDYMKPSTRGEGVHCRAECYKLTRSVAFVRAFAYHADPDDVIAAATATVMIGTHIPRSG